MILLSQFCPKNYVTNMMALRKINVPQCIDIFYRMTRYHCVSDMGPITSPVELIRVCECELCVDL